MMQSSSTQADYKDNERRVERLANTLMEHLIVNNSTTAGTIIEIAPYALEQVVQNVLLLDSSDDDFNDDEQQQELDLQFLSRVVRRVAQKTKQDSFNIEQVQKKKRNKPSSSTTTTTASKNNKSVSLFSSLPHVPLPVFITREQVEEAAKSKEQELLELLQSVEHVDDVMQMWSDTVLPALSRALTEDSVVLRDPYIELCSKWFGQFSKLQSMENLLAQHDLCRLMAAKSMDDGGGDDDDNVIIEMFTKMWTFLLSNMLELQPNLSWNVEDDHCIAILLVLQYFGTNDESSRIPTKLALMDPYSHWFVGWIHQVHPLKLTKVVSKLVPYLMATMAAIGTDAQNFSKEAVVLWTQSICMLQSCLVVTRVALFPWKVVSTTREASTNNDAPNDANNGYNPPSVEQLRVLVDVFCHGIEHGPKKEQQRLVDSCVVGLETILEGIRYTQEDVYKEIRNALQIRLSTVDNSIVKSLLQKEE